MDGRNHPSTLSLNLDGIPKLLRERDQWVCWRWEFRDDGKGDGKWTKVPVNARTGGNADPSKPSTWNAYSAATYYWQKHRDEVHGIGYVFAADDPFAGIDLDEALDPQTKKLRPEALAIIDRFDSFTEWSISGTGVHILIEGKVPPGRNRRGKIEMYSEGRFFVVSGQVIQNADVIGARQEELEAFHRETFPELYEPKIETRQPLTTAPLSIADDVLLKRCEGSALFNRLWDGDDSDYGDDASSADLAFCNIVVRNSGDREQVDAIYRRSGRARPKWDERRGDRTYGEMTLDQAFDGTVKVWEPRERPKPHLAVLPPADDLPDDLPSLKAIIIDLRLRVIEAEQRAEAAEARAAKLSELQSKTTGIIRNKNLGQERFTAVALAYQLGNREVSGDAGDGGLYRMPLARIAESAGVSEDTASKHLQKLEKEGMIRREVKWVPRTVNRETGEIIDAHKALFVGPASNVTDFVEAVAKLAPEKPKNWGGSRIHCPNHPDADVIKTTTWHCSECGEVLNSETEIIQVSPQDADLPEELAATGTEGASSPAHRDRRGYTSTRSVSGTVSHNTRLHNTQTAGSSPLAQAWLNAKPIPPQVDQGVTL